jgi:hypothetical protein
MLIEEETFHELTAIAVPFEIRAINAKKSRDTMVETFDRGEDVDLDDEVITLFYDRPEGLIPIESNVTKLVQCVIHYGMRGGEVHINILATLCFERAGSKRKDQTDVKERLASLFDLLRRLAGCGQHWVCKIDAKKNEVQTPGLHFYEAKKLYDEKNTEELDRAVDIALWCTRSGIGLAEEREAWKKLGRMFVALFALFRKGTGFYTDAELEKIRELSDSFGRLLVRLSGASWITNYLHHIIAGHFHQMAVIWGNIYRLRNEGAEAAVKWLRNKYFKGTGHGGHVKGVAGGSDRVKQLGMALTRLYGWLSGRAHAALNSSEKGQHYLGNVNRQSSVDRVRAAGERGALAAAEPAELAAADTQEAHTDEDEQDMEDADYCEDDGDVIWLEGEAPTTADGPEPLDESLLRDLSSDSDSSGDEGVSEDSCRRQYNFRSLKQDCLPGFADGFVIAADFTGGDSSDDDCGSGAAGGQEAGPPGGGGGGGNSSAVHVAIRCAQRKGFGSISTDNAQRPFVLPSRAMPWVVQVGQHQSASTSVVSVVGRVRANVDLHST